MRQLTVDPGNEAVPDQMPAAVLQVFIFPGVAFIRERLAVFEKMRDRAKRAGTGLAYLQNFPAGLTDKVFRLGVMRFAEGFADEHQLICFQTVHIHEIFQIVGDGLQRPQLSVIFFSASRRFISDETMLPMPSRICISCRVHWR